MRVTPREGLASALGAAVAVCALSLTIVLTKGAFAQEKSSQENSVSSPEELNCCQKLGLLQASVVEAMNLSYLERRNEARALIREALERTGLKCEIHESKRAPRLECE